MWIVLSFLAGLTVYAVIRVVVTGLYTVGPDKRAVITSFGKAEVVPSEFSDVDDGALSPQERERYRYPKVRVVTPGGPTRSRARTRRSCGP